MSLRARIILFIVILFACAALTPPLPRLIGFGIACGSYLIIVLPAIGGRK